MIRARLIPALAAGLLLAACAAPQEGSAPAPAARFEPGGNLVKEVDIAPGDASVMGIWQGPYVPVDMATETVAGPPAGIATLNVGDVDGSRTRGLMSWEDEDADFRSQRWTGALTMTGHIMLLHSHFIMMEQDGVRFLQADVLLPDGRFYRHRLRKIE